MYKLNKKLFVLSAFACGLLIWFVLLWSENTAIDSVAGKFLSNFSGYGLGLVYGLCTFYSLQKINTGIFQKVIITASWIIASAISYATAVGVTIFINLINIGSIFDFNHGYQPNSSYYFLGGIVGALILGLAFYTIIKSNGLKISLVWVALAVLAGGSVPVAFIFIQPNDVAVAESLHLVWITIVTTLLAVSVKFENTTESSQIK